MTAVEQTGCRGSGESKPLGLGSSPGRRRKGWFGSPVVQRFGTFAEDFDVLVVGVDPIALATGNFLDDAQALQCVYGARGRWKCDICASGEVLDACKRTIAE